MGMTDTNKNTLATTSVEKKEYEKPQAQKHTSVAVVSGSGGCSSYSSTTSGGVYYY